MRRITVTTDLGMAAADAHLVIEAVSEVMSLKKDVFKELDGMCQPGTILASNTSGLSITEMAAVTRRPDRFIGMHFFNPVPVMKLVELIRGFRDFRCDPCREQGLRRKNREDAHRSQGGARFCRQSDPMSHDQ